MHETAGWGVFGASVRLNSRTVLHDVTMRAEPGQVAAVVGGDGAGKSTLLRTLAGVVPPTSGGVRCPPPARIGFLSASSGLYPDLTVLENLRFSAAVYGLSADAAGPRIDAVLARIGLAGVPDRLAGRLSGGMRRKLGLVRAVVHEPDLLILDDPTTGVDPVSRADVWWLIAQETARGCAVVVSTSYLDEAERAGQVLVLDAGRVLLSGTPAGIVGAMGGTLRCGPDRPPDGYAWRRGRGWRSWQPDLGGHGRPVCPDLQDAVILAALRNEVNV